MNMLKDIYPEGIQAGKSNLPSPFPSYRLILRKGALKNVMDVKGWRTYEDVASALNFTRQYICMIANSRVSVSTEFVARLAASIGNINGNWHVLYELAPWGVIDDRHPTWNQQKYMGQIPYEQYSLSGEGRSRDYTVEKKPSYAELAMKEK